MFANFGCAKSKSHKEESLQLRAYRLIDENRTDEAISLLSEELEKRELSMQPDEKPSSETNIDKRII
jgi:hypothetical protein